jgi:hypothetical protein
MGTTAEAIEALDAGVFVSPKITPEIAAQAHTLTALAHTFKVTPEALILVLDKLLAQRISHERAGAAESEEELLRLRGVRQAERILNEIGATLSSEEVAERLGITRQAVNDARKRGALLAFSQPVGRGERYPLWQFDGMIVRPWVPKLIQLLGNGFPALSFLMAKRTSLGGHRHLDLSLSGDEAVIQKMLDQAGRIGNPAA